MTRTLVSSSAALALGFGVMGMAPDRAVAEEDFPSSLPSTCTLENVAGVYGFNADTLQNAARQIPVSGVGILDLRPDGTAARFARGYNEVGGEPRIGPPREGEWTVRPNCTGFIDFPEFVTAAGATTEVDVLFVAVENSSELFLVSNNPLEEDDAKLLFRR